MNSEYTNIYGASTKKGLKTSFDLSSVEKVSINGQDYLKFVNPETGEMELIENNSNDSLQTQFEKIRDYYSIKQSDDARKNTKIILDFKQKYDSQKVSFVKIEDMVNNYGDYERQLSSLNSSQMKVLNYLIVLLLFLLHRQLRSEFHVVYQQRSFVEVGACWCVCVP